MDRPDHRFRPPHPVHRSARRRASPRPERFNDTLASCAGMEDWLPIANIAELRGAAREAATLPPRGDWQRAATRGDWQHGAQSEHGGAAACGGACAGAVAQRPEVTDGAARWRSGPKEKLLCGARPSRRGLGAVAPQLCVADAGVRCAPEEPGAQETNERRRICGSRRVAALRSLLP